MKFTEKNKRNIRRLSKRRSRVFDSIRKAKAQSSLLLIIPNPSKTRSPS